MQASLRVIKPEGAAKAKLPCAVFDVISNGCYSSSATSSRSFFVKDGRRASLHTWTRKMVIYA